MSVADWALIISLASLGISLAGFVWSVWSKFIFPKPRVQTSMQVMFVQNLSGTRGPPFVALHATNHGPIDVTLHAAIARQRKRWPWHKLEVAFLNPYPEVPTDETVLESLNNSGVGPFSGGLPKKLSVGEQFSTYFPLVGDWFTEDHLVNFGYHDTFGRNHWAPKRHVQEVQNRILNSDY